MQVMIVISLIAGGIGELKKHDLFANVDWEGLSESTPPKMGPYLPPSDSEVNIIWEFSQLCSFIIDWMIVIDNRIIVI